MTKKPSPPYLFAVNRDGERNVAHVEFGRYDSLWWYDLLNLVSGYRGESKANWAYARLKDHLVVEAKAVLKEMTGEDIDYDEAVDLVREIARLIPASLKEPESKPNHIRRHLKKMGEDIHKPAEPEPEPEAEPEPEHKPDAILGLIEDVVTTAASALTGLCLKVSKRGKNKGKACGKDPGHSGRCNFNITAVGAEEFNERVAEHAEEVAGPVEDQDEPVGDTPEAATENGEGEPPDELSLAIAEAEAMVGRLVNYQAKVWKVLKVGAGKHKTALWLCAPDADERQTDDPLIPYYEVELVEDNGTPPAPETTPVEVSPVDFSKITKAKLLDLANKKRESDGEKPFPKRTKKDTLVEFLHTFVTG